MTVVAPSGETPRMADPMLAVAPIEKRVAQDLVVAEHYLPARTYYRHAKETL